MKRPDTERILTALKDFQRDTVDYAFKRMYLDDPPARRFLVADEVGLGKTLVAKGIVARALDHLWDKDFDLRIDIIYICSNLSIARQNINRLNFTGRKDHSLPGRITLLPRDIHDLKNRKLNFVSFTPGTSFNLRSNHGLAEERALLYWLLPEEWIEDRKGTISVLTGPSVRSGFDQRVQSFPKTYSIDEDLRNGFHKELGFANGIQRQTGVPTLFERFRTLADQLGSRERLSDHERAERAKIIGSLRSTLAASCLHALEPDLIILDEFQRFRDLLKGQDDASQLALKLFNWSDARVLLLSATPYKMYTLSDESTGEDHFTDFIQTLSFLHNDAARTEALKKQLSVFRRELFKYGNDNGAVIETARQNIESSLRRVMVRTERLGVTPDRNGMLAEVPTQPRLQPQDLRSYLALQQVARAIDHPDTLEYWKSAPYLLNFMDDYKLKTQFERAATGGRSSFLYNILKPYPDALFSRSDIESYKSIDPANARLRTILSDVITSGAWSVFWLPPCLPYYQLSGRYENPELPKFTKRLIFSSWQVVPKVVSAFLSYEAERRLYGIPIEGQVGSNTSDARKRRARLLQFRMNEGRPASMPALAMAYPCITLAKAGDPLLIAGELQKDGPAETPSLQDVLRKVHSKVTALTEKLLPTTGDTSAVDERWYWAAPILLDLTEDEQAARSWWEQPNLAGLWRGASNSASADDDETDFDEEGTTAWTEHVEAARRLLSGGGGSLGMPPPDLYEVLSLLAVTGPGTIALRSLCRVVGGLEMANDCEVRNLAGQVAHGLLALFNLPDVTVSLQQESGEDAYWQKVLNHCAEGCLQSVIDEYAHVLVEWLGMQGKSRLDIARQVAKSIADSISVRTATISADLITPDESQTALLVGDKIRFRSRFAARFGGQGVDEMRAVERQSELQKAFNSPFWPFVLCTTSVGQEGLDFHLYCHAVVHWNLPANPVDLEQREGRVHRFKGHAVRKNIARQYSAQLLQDDPGTDPWASLFKLARLNRETNTSDLIPYWVFPSEDGAKIERHVPFLPMSTDVDRAARLRRSLALYRMAFGQSRQEDLMLFLLKHVPADDVDEVTKAICIDLSPEQSQFRNNSGEDLEPQSLPGEDERTPRLSEASSSLSELQDLLNRFTELRSKSEIRKQKEQGVNPARNFKTKTFALLLDGFAALVDVTQRNNHSEVTRGCRNIMKLLDLLNQFSAIRPPKQDVGVVISQYNDLLNEFSKYSAQRLQFKADASS